MLIYDYSGVMVIHGAFKSERTLRTETSEDIVDVSTHDTRVVTSYNPFRTDTMYFGNYSQCHDSGFAACP
jgi:hypothetical protein